jgi:hypothetical protein
VKSGRGSPHGGVFLDISWIKEKLPNAAKHIQKKLPSMYHQFKELADVDITKGPMEVGPTCHYVMGGIRVDGDTAQTTVPGLFAAGECAAGLHGANRLGGNSLSDLLVFGRRAGLAAAKYAKEVSSPTIDPAQVSAAETYALEPFQRQHGESPYAIHRDLQKTMQSLVGIFRTRGDVEQALTELGQLNERYKLVSVEGSRMFNPGWHLALDLHSMLRISEAVAKGALVREESRGAHSRIDFPETSAEWGKEQHHQPGFQRPHESPPGFEIRFAGRVEASPRRGRRQMKSSAQMRCGKELRGIAHRANHLTARLWRTDSRNHGHSVEITGTGPTEPRVRRAVELPSVVEVFQAAPLLPLLESNKRAASRHSRRDRIFDARTAFVAPVLDAFGLGQRQSAHGIRPQSSTRRSDDENRTVHGQDEFLALEAAECGNSATLGRRDAPRVRERLKCNSERGSIAFEIPRACCASSEKTCRQDAFVPQDKPALPRLLSTSSRRAD